MDRLTLFTLSTAVAMSAVISFAVPAMSVGTPAPPYANYTVGDASGWFFNYTSNSSITNYTTWAASKSFYLGDFLIFNTNSNTTVVQTYNATTYILCDAGADDGDETFVYTPQNNSNFGVAGVVSVPLTSEGANYFFSDAGEEGIQCARGMRFRIKVARGRGLPPELSQPPPPPYVDVQVPPPPLDTPGDSQGEQFYRDGAADGFRRGIWRRSLTAGALAAFIFV
ncbi:hypothetical protein KSP39_PZI017177 [Platanthera zijinensis]|uniref:Phytocyanin domain-containing protein n=1 Tax=Platanthera zijinensis TaxID=2320716 RepID=A0AAP0B4Z5_9ASPA